jgi:hypothetical protein
VLADDRAHYAFFADAMRLQLKFEPEGVRDKLQAALASFALPALPGMPDGPRRLETMAKHGILVPWGRKTARRDRSSNPS